MHVTLTIFLAIEISAADRGAKSQSANAPQTALTEPEVPRKVTSVDNTFPLNTGVDGGDENPSPVEIDTLVFDLTDPTVQ